MVDRKDQEKMAQRLNSAIERVGVNLLDRILEMVAPPGQQVELRTYTVAIQFTTEDNSPAKFITPPPDEPFTIARLEVYAQPRIAQTGRKGWRERYRAWRFVKNRVLFRLLIDGTSIAHFPAVVCMTPYNPNDKPPMDLPRPIYLASGQRMAIHAELIIEGSHIQEPECVFSLALHGWVRQVVKSS